MNNQVIRRLTLVVRMLRLNRNGVQAVIDWSQSDVTPRIPHGLDHPLLEDAVNAAFLRGKR